MCVDGAFKALADTSRRRLLHSLNARNGQSLRARALADLKTVLEQRPNSSTPSLSRPTQSVSGVR